uniref:uncharacterized protein LOC131108999 n=1 Tax=Doryrhamphus excisus TaxID=161450 RepID=UPI0025ADD53B|nr:uncharacterized protein LOC131108999 [Doryrhamphus excisus]XP_057916496.1 uncharacterized protein LOC131108999 [Doryrhamphus excisus]
MGLSCCRPESPCGSVEERSSLLKDDGKAAGPTGDRTMVGACGPEGDENIRKTAVDAILKVDGGDNKVGVQVKLLSNVGEPEPAVAQENGSLQREAMHTHKAAAVTENSTGEENTETQAKSAATDPPQEVKSEWEGSPRAAMEVHIQQESLTEADDDPNSPCKNTSDICRHDGVDAGAIVANGSALIVKLWPSTDALSDTQESPVCTAHPGIKADSACLSSEDPDNESCPALTDSQEGKDFNGSSASEWEPKIERHNSQEKRPAEEPLTTAPEDASNSPEEEASAENISQNAVEDLQDRLSPKFIEDKKLEEVQNDHVEAHRNVEIEEENGEDDPEEVVRKTEDGLKSGEEDLYRAADDLSASHVNDDARPATLLETTLEARCSLGPPMDILSYSEREWRGHTAKSALIRKGYKEMSRHFAGVRQVRGDNYCALRATLFQALSQTAQVPAWLQDNDIAKLPQELAAQSGLISQWRFPGECLLQGDVVQQLQSYVELLQNKWRAAAGCSSAEERLQLCERTFQGGEEELAMLEALKLLMLARTVELHGHMQAGRDVPLFCWLLFARDSSDCPRSFLANHLGHVGLSAGLEQVEMFLLGYALQCTIRVYRLYMADTEEFVAYYPDDHKDDWPCVSLVTEDDRHYNVPVADAAETAEEVDSS